MSDHEGQGPFRFEISAPTELEQGSYANFLSVWHTPHEFTLDFATTMPTQSVETPSGDQETVVPCRVVARVKVPVTVVFDMLRALNENLTKYEERFGEIRRPGEPGA